MVNRLLRLVARRPEGGGILIVDDDQYLRSGLRLILAEGGYEKRDRIYEAADGESALQLAFRHNPEVVILDYRMPGMDGTAVARGLRAMLKDARIIMFSGFDPGAAAGEADHFIMKPHIEDLLQLVANGQEPVVEAAPVLRLVTNAENEQVRTGT